MIHLLQGVPSNGRGNCQVDKYRCPVKKRSSLTRYRLASLASLDRVVRYDKSQQVTIPLLIYSEHVVVKQSSRRLSFIL